MARDTLSTSAVVTGEELFEMGDIGPCELVNGRIVAMSPTGGRHGHIEAFLVTELGLFARRGRAGWVLSGEVGIYTRLNPDTVRGADVAFISKSRCPQEPPTGFLRLAPELVIEVLSPTDRESEMREKVSEYFSVGVERVWVVDPVERRVTVWRSPAQARAYGPGERLAGEGALAGFAVEVADLFGDA